MINFFQKPPFGLNISDHSVKVISLEGQSNNSKLLALGRAVLEPGVIENSKIMKKERLESTLRSLIKNPQFGRIKTNRLIFSFPESKSLFHFLKFPPELKKTEESEFIKSQAAQFFPYQLKDLYFDFQIIDREVLLFAAPKNIIDDYLEVFKNCQLQIQAMEIESESLARVLISDTKEPVLIIDIGEKNTNFSLFDDKRPKLSTTIEIAGNRLTQVIAENLNISHEEAEKIKKEIGLNHEAKEGKVFLVLQKEIQGIIEEIKKIDDYFEEKEQKEIKKIILTGGSGLLPSLLEYLTENVEKEVAIADPWIKINIDILKNKKYFEEALKINYLIYSSAIGAALRGLAGKPEKNGINLIKNL